ncbi:MAG: metallophosphoesterase [Planctomycetaceae bacterium]
MTVLTGFLILLLACIGNAELWVVLINRWHSRRSRHEALRRIRRFHDVGVLLFPPFIFWVAGLCDNGLLRGGTYQDLSGSVQALLAVAGTGLIPFVASVSLWQTRGRTSRLKRTTADVFDVLALAESDQQRDDVIGNPDSWLSGFPGNQIFQLEVNTKQLLVHRGGLRKPRTIPRQISKLVNSVTKRTGVLSMSARPTVSAAVRSAKHSLMPQALKLGHLSDVHLIGCPGREYYRFVTEQLCRMQPDAFVFTGDLIDNASLLPWATEMFQRLADVAPGYFILGNHDWHLDYEAVRAALVATGWTDLGQKSEIVCLGDWNVLIAGTEAPWIGSNPDVPLREDEHLRILLSHTPDQRDFAVSSDIDLMLSGHNHGGQVVLPIVGPVYSPSQFGVRYSGGVYEFRDLLIHVSRGCGAMDPLRFNCRPEITLLELQVAMPHSLSEKPTT